MTEQTQPEDNKQQGQGNSLQVGEITLYSSQLDMGQLIGYLLGLLDEPRVKEYLSDLSKRKLLNISKSYMN